MITVAQGHAVITQGEEGAEAYIVARGELEVRRDPYEPGEEPAPQSNGEPTELPPAITLARLVNGALFGEMALLSRAPRAASVVACRPSILLVARRDALEEVAETRPEVGIELAAHCRRRMVANLVRTSPGAPRGRSRRSAPRSSRPSRRACSRRASASSPRGRSRRGST